MIDNQQVKYKISILFFGSLIVCRSCFPFFVDWGGGTKNGSPAGPISGRWSVPHIILPEYPSYFLTTISPSISFNLLYLRYN